MAQAERRTFSGTELRTLSNFEISGIAAAYNTKSSNLGGFKERIAPGAFASAFRSGADVRILFNHDPSQILGRTKAGTATLSDSPAGLRFSCKLDPQNSRHQDVYRAIARGDIDQCSFGFTVNPGGEDLTDEGDLDETGRRLKLRTLRSVTLLDCSPVTYPAYPEGTQVDARSRAAVSPLLVPDYIIRPAVAITDAQRRAKAERLGQLIAVDLAAWEAVEKEQARSLRSLQRCMESLAGITYGKRY